ncbi:MAG: hypothetical protein V1774_06285 [Candidatus Eisenbacteria bacterium]
MQAPAHPPAGPVGAHAHAPGAASPVPAALRNRHAWIAVVLIAVAAAVLALRAAGYGLLGWDTYPLILTSRIATVGDLARIFTERLMQGLYPSEFYRPLVNLTIAFDHAVWGLRPAGYHLTTVILFAACAAALYRLMARLAGRGARIAPLAGLLFFLLHPSHVEVIPVVARHAELLSGLFMALALSAHLAPRRLRDRGLPWLPALLALPAYLAKESAYILPALAFLTILLYAPTDAPRTGLTPRLRPAARALIPHAIALAIALLARFAVLGHWGGHTTTGLTGALGRFPSYFGAMMKWVLLPQETMQRSGTAIALLLLLAAGLTATLLLAASRHAAPAGGPRAHAPLITPLAAGAVHPLRMASLGAAWLFLIGIVYAVAAEMSPWYMFLPAMGLAMLCGGLGEALVRAARPAPAGAGRHTDRARVTHAAGLRSLAGRGIAAGTFLLLVLLLLGQARFSPLVYPYYEWREATRVGEQFLDQIRIQLAESPPGTVLEGPPVPTWVLPAAERAGRPRVYGAAIFAEYTLQAWSGLVFPDRNILVKVAPEASHAQAGRDQVLLVLTRRLPGF